MAFYGVDIPRPDPGQPDPVRREPTELGIPAGLQDRVAQVYEGLVYMDFNREHHGAAGLRPLRAAGSRAAAAALHRLPRPTCPRGPRCSTTTSARRFERGEPEVRRGHAVLGGPDRPGARPAPARRRAGTIGPLLNANFDRRREIYQISEGNLRMVDGGPRPSAPAPSSPAPAAPSSAPTQDEAMFQRARATRLAAASASRSSNRRSWRPHQETPT